MQVPPEIQNAIAEAVKKHGQSTQFEARFRKFFENIVTGNHKHTDLEELIAAVETDDEDEEDL